MEEALRTLLVDDATLAGLVGTRVFWIRRSQDDSALPAVVLQRIAGNRDADLSAPTGLVESRVQADCYGETFGAAKTAARALISVVNGYRGTVSGTEFQGIFIGSERDSTENESAADRHLFRTMIDFTIWHDE